MIKKNKDVKINGYRVLKKLFKKYENEKWVHTKDYIEKFKNKYYGRYSKYENPSVENMVYVTKSGIGICDRYGDYELMFFREKFNSWDDFKINSICLDDFKMRFQTRKGLFFTHFVGYYHIETPDWRTNTNHDNYLNYIFINKNEYNFFNEFILEFEKEVDKEYLKLLEKKENEQKEREIRKIEKSKTEKIKREKWLKTQEEIRLNKIQRKKVLQEGITKFIEEFDSDKDGIIDFNQGGDDFMNLLKKHQKTIIEHDKDYIKNFIQVSNYLKTKRENIQFQFQKISTSKNINDLKDCVGVLKNQIDTFNLLNYNSLLMIISVVDSDLITFNEIYLTFDKLNIFNSNWEKEVSNKLKNMDLKLGDLIYSINKMELSIVNEIMKMSIMNQLHLKRVNNSIVQGNDIINESFSNLNESLSSLNSSLSSNLKSIDSNIKVNNLLNVISTYQTYKINKNTKSLRG